jgi:serine protease
MPKSLLPQVVVKFADSVPIKLGQGDTLSLDQLADIRGSNGSGAIDAIRKLLPDLAFSSNGIIGATDQGHGTGVLGVIAALDNPVGVVSIAPLTAIRVAGVYDLFQDGTVMVEHVAPKIALAAGNLAFGDVVLLELQQQKRPVELDRAVFAAIQLVTTGGRDCRGRGRQCRRQPRRRAVSRRLRCHRGRRMLGRRAPFPVPGDQLRQPHRLPRLGRRRAHDRRRNDPVRANSYFEISGTSSAAAIIAGVCLLIQHLQRLNGGAPLSPIAVRDILRRTENGTETAAPFVDRIGVMPDLQKIIANQGF